MPRSRTTPGRPPPLAFAPRSSSCTPRRTVPLSARGARAVTAPFVLTFDFEDWHQLVLRRIGGETGATGASVRGPRRAHARPARRARRDCDVLRRWRHRRPAPGRAAGGGGSRARDRLPRPRAPARVPAHARRVQARRRAVSSRPLRRPAAWSPSATGRRGSRSTARPPGRTASSASSASATTRASSTRRASRIGSIRSRRTRCRSRTGCGSSRSPSARRGRLVLPLGGGAYWRALPAAVLWRGLEWVGGPVDAPGPLLPPVRVRPRAARGRAACRGGATCAAAGNVTTRPQERPPSPDRGAAPGSGVAVPARAGLRRAPTNP